MNKNTQALHEALVSLWRKLGEKTLLKLKEQQYEAQAAQSQNELSGVAGF